MNAIEIDIDLEDIFDDFLSLRREDIDNLKRAIPASDYKSIQVIGHQLTGNAGSYGVTPLEPIGKKLELAAKDKNLQMIKDLTKEYEIILDNLIIKFV